MGSISLQIPGVFGGSATVGLFGKEECWVGFGTKLLLGCRWILLPSEGVLCLCNRSSGARYTMSAIICIDLFAFHSEVFNVAT